jgi:ribosomal protein S18 acetylase RimI-like enzyme
MDNLNIRIARIEDLDAIVDLIQRDSFIYNENDPTDYPRAFEEIANHPDNELVVAVRGEEVVGTLQLTFIPGLNYGGAWRAQVEAVRVRQNLRNLRIGTRLMEWVIERARARNCRVVQLTTNVARKDAQCPSLPKGA